MESEELIRLGQALWKFKLEKQFKCSKKEKAWKYSKHNPYKSVRKTRNNNLSQICKEK